MCGIDTRRALLDSMRVSREEVVDLLSKLIEIPSVSGYEAEIAFYIRELLEGWGVSVRLEEVLPNRYNLIAEIGKGRRVLMLNGHLDTVAPEDWNTPPFKAVVCGDYIYGLGAVDMKGGLTAMLLAFKNLLPFENQIGGRVILAFVVDEEEQGRGTQHLVEKGILADAAIVGEPTSLRICTSQLGYVDLTVMVFGKAAHGSFPQRGVNAVEGAIEFLSMFKESKIVKEGEVLSMNINRFVGGTRSVVVPLSCRLELNLNLKGGVKEEDVKREARTILENLRRKGVILGYHVETSNYGEAFSVNEHEKIVSAISRAFRTVCGKDVEHMPFTAWTDAETLFLKAKIPVVIFGPGDCAVAHTPYEHICTKDVMIASKVYALTALEFLISKL